MAAETVEIASVGEYWGHHTVPHELTMRDLRQMRRNFTGPIVIDYEHSTHDPEAAEAPAAGWVTEVLIEEDTLMATVEWTDRAAAMIDTDEYRFLSPVIVKDSTDQEGQEIGTELVSVALTNLPFYDHLNGEEGVTSTDGVATIPPMTDQAVLNTRFENDDSEAGDGPDSSTETNPNDPVMDYESRWKQFKNRIATIFNTGSTEELDVLDEARQIRSRNEELEDRTDELGDELEEVQNERDQLQDRVDELEDEIEEQEETANEELLNEAVENYRIQNSDREEWAERLEENPEAARMALNSIPKGAAKPGSSVDEPEETGSTSAQEGRPTSRFHEHVREQAG